MSIHQGTIRYLVTSALVALICVLSSGCNFLPPATNPGTTDPNTTDPGTQSPGLDPAPGTDPEPSIQASACGLFAPECVPTIGGSPFVTIAADLDGDDDIDLAVANLFADNVSIIRNDGTGKFVETEKIPVGQNPLGLQAFDVDADGDTDLLVLNAGDDTIALLRNDGTGTFQQDPLIQAGDGSLVFTEADVDNDGDGDLMLANLTTTLSIDQPGSMITLRNDGTGRFDVASSTAIGPSPISILAADLDGDNDQDAAVVDQGLLASSILRNDGTGVFAAPQTRELNGAIPLFNATGDIDGDNDQDLVITNFGDPFDAMDNGNVILLINDGTGGFSEMRTLLAGTVPYFPALVDLDNDGDLDLAVANDGSDDVSIFQNDGAGNFTLSETVTVGDGPEYIAVADFDADGDSDLAVTSFRGGGIAILLNGGSGHFSAQL